MIKADITDFLLWEKEDGFSGYAKYFGLKEYRCVIKKTGRSYTVLILVDGKWQPIGKYYPYSKPIKIRGNKLYDCVGEIWTPDYTYHLLKDGNRYIGL